MEGGVPTSQSWRSGNNQAPNPTMQQPMMTVTEAVIQNRGSSTVGPPPPTSRVDPLLPGSNAWQQAAHQPQPLPFENC